MRRNLLAGAVLGLVLGPVAHHPAAAAELAICNRSTSAYLIAMIERYLVILKDVWQSSGWYRIEPGECRDWSRGRVNTLYLLSVTRITPRGRRVNDYGVDPIPDWHWNSGAYGIQEFYCVSDEPYGRRAEARSAYSRCQPGEYLQLFNLHVFVEHNSNYTLNLR